MTRQTEAGLLGWDIMADEAIVVPDLRSPRTMTALVDDNGKVLVVGFLIARGPENHYVIQHPTGGMDYLCGKPARGGIVRDSHCQRKPTHVSLERGMEIADELLGCAEQISGPRPGDLCFKRCEHNRYQIERMSLRHRVRVERGKDTFYPRPDLGTGIKSFLTASNLICTHPH